MLERLPFPVMRTGAQAGTVLASRLVGAAANVAAVLVLTQNMTRENVGIVLTALAAAVLGELAATLGRDGVAVQAIPQALARNDRARASAYLRSLIRQAAVFAPLGALGVGLVLFAVTDGAASPIAMLLAGLVVPAMTAMRILSRAVMAAGQVAQGAMLMMAMRPLIFLALLALLARHGALSIEAALGASVCAAVLGTAVQAGAGARALAFLRTAPSQTDPAWRRSGLQLLLSMLMLGELPSLVTLIASAVLAEADIAVLGVALRFAGLVGLGTSSLIAAVGPRLSAAWSQQSPTDVARIGRSVATVSAPATFGVVSLIWVLAPYLLSLIGDGYAAGAWALRVLVLMPLVTACAGPSLLVLTAAGRAEQAARAAFVCVPAVAIGIVIGGFFSVLGVAVGVLTAFVVWELSLVLRLKQAVGLSLWLPFFRRATL